MLIAIVAADRNWGIGKDDALLAHIPEDMKFFREHTSGHPVIMGRKTLESFPGGRPLKNRKNIVISDNPAFDDPAAIVVRSIPEAMQHVAGDEEAFIIGGGMVYRQFMPIADKLYITHIHHTWEDADTFFPVIEPAIWQQTAAERHEADERNPYPFTYAEYVRVNC
jgi:dihydrofolate reductase